MAYNISLLCDNFFKLIQDWQSIFPGQRSYQKISQLAIGNIMNQDRKTISKSLICLGKDQDNWAPYYDVFSDTPWRSEELFQPVFDFWHEYYQKQGWFNSPVIASIDWSIMKKNGKKIPHTQHFRDPLSPHFHTNLIWGQRFLQVSANFPMEQVHLGPARSIPVSFRLTSRPAPLKGKDKKDPAKQKAYRQLEKELTLTQYTLKEIEGFSQRAGKWASYLIMSGDGGFCNRQVFRANYPKTGLLCRCRKDAALYYPVLASQQGVGRKRIYGEKAPTPEEVLKDEKISWQETELWIGDHKCLVRYKTVQGLLWKGTGKDNQINLLVIKGQPYLSKGSKKRNYREPIYLFYKGSAYPEAYLVQWYLWRSQIEVNIRDEKQLFGLGEGQVWNEKTVENYPAFQVGLYGLMLLGALKVYGFRRGENYLPVARWQKKTSEERPSSEEILKKLRYEIQGEVVKLVWNNFEGFADKKFRRRSLQNEERDEKRYVGGFGYG